MTSFRKTTTHTGHAQLNPVKDTLPSETAKPTSQEYTQQLPIAAANPRELLTKQEVCERLRVCIRSFDKMLARREFPKPVRLGKRDYWSSEPVNHWLSRRFAVQESWRIT